MSSLKAFTAEIENTFANFSETGDIDRVSIKTWVISCLREFGKNICELRETIVKVENSQAILPDSFKSLKLALNLEEKGYSIKGCHEKAKNSTIYRERIENPGYYDWITREFVTNCHGKLITESVIMNTEPAEFYYTPTYLSVVKGFKKESFDTDCLNLHPSIRNSYPHQVNINKRTLQANFKEGRIYVQYYSLPTDDEGEIEIPEITTGEILLYIENYVKIKIAENLILNNKNATGVSSLLPMWLGQNNKLKMGAKSEANYNGLPNDWHKNYNRKLQIEAFKYNLPRF
jgi:hypothetical protein